MSLLIFGCALAIPMIMIRAAMRPRKNRTVPEIINTAYPMQRNKHLYFDYDY